jgi:PII-like signaling protein
VNDDCLKLSVYFGESDRVGGRLLSDRLLERFERHEARAAVLLRGVEGFGLAHRLHTDRFLTLSEDLPLVAVAVDERRRIEGLVPHVTELVTGGLVTLERARLLHGEIRSVALPEKLHEATKLTVYLGRDERVAGRPAYLEVVDHLRRCGLAGATVLLGVDGVAHGSRRRARFFSQNADVPLVAIAVGAGETVSAALAGLGSLVGDPIVTLERVRICKRDGVLLAEPHELPQRDDTGLGIWQKLMVYAGEQARHDGHPLYVELVRRLRHEGCAGATALRGIWGSSGEHAPHGDRLLALRRRVPVVTTIVDTPERARRWFRIVDELTDEAGLVTSEMVPAYLAVAPEARVGGLELGRLQ